MRITPTHIVARYENERNDTAIQTTAALAVRRAELEGLLPQTRGNRADYIATAILAIDDELAERTDGTTYDLYHRNGKVIR